MSTVLSISEGLMAATIGVNRHLAAVKRGLENKHGANSDRAWQYHIEGACGELAVAKSLGISWSGSINTFKAGGLICAAYVLTFCQGS